MDLNQLTYRIYPQAALSTLKIAVAHLRRSLPFPARAFVFQGLLVNMAYSCKRPGNNWFTLTLIIARKAGYRDSPHPCLDCRICTIFSKRLGTFTHCTKCTLRVGSVLESISCPPRLPKKSKSWPTAVSLRRPTTHVV